MVSARTPIARSYVAAWTFGRPWVRAVADSTMFASLTSLTSASISDFVWPQGRLTTVTPSQCCHCRTNRSNVGLAASATTHHGGVRTGDVDPWFQLK